jgi:hypothetical protein
MSLLSNLLGMARGSGAARDSEQSAQRMAEWDQALQSGRLPSFVEARLAAAAAGKVPWVATMSAAEFGLARGKGVRPLAMVSGTCWLHYGYSWTRGHAEGWRTALARLQHEARAVGANAVVDVKMRTVRLAVGESMDFTLLGTAVRIDRMPEATHPIVATVPALEFVRLIEAGITPVGIALGAQYQFLDPGVGMLMQSILGGSGGGGRIAMTSSSAARVQGSSRPFTNAVLPELSQFWEGIRRAAVAELLRDVQRQGTGVLAHTQLGQLFRVEQNNSPPRFLGRHIVIGTVVNTRRAIPVPHEIRAALDMRGTASPLSHSPPAGRHAYPANEQGGAI